MMSEEQVETGTLIEAGGRCWIERLPGQSEWLTGIDHKKRHLFFSSFPMSAGVGSAVHVPLKHVVKSLPVLGVLCSYLGETSHDTQCAVLLHSLH